ncbi:hypothetical protein F4677DRAFT_155902 [Hypoxylon crocopeplum]|nr:hypothetical protein F4677DRAFT_155902 [Hypoxylon crocopeplum]
MTLDPTHYQRCNKTYQMKAKALVLLGHLDDALTSLGEAPEISKHPIIYFNEFVEGMSWESDKIIRLLDILKDNHHALVCSAKAHRIIQKATENATESEKGEIQRWYRKEIEKSSQLYRRSGLRLFQADFEKIVMGDLGAAKKHIENALWLESDGLKWIIPGSWRLADVLLEEFLREENPEVKQLILVKMEDLVQLVKNRQVLGFDPELSQTSIPLAIMRWKMGPTAGFYKDMNAVFTGCLGTLNDSAAENDPESFRMLAKVLALLAFPRETQVAYICQFYDMGTTRNILPTHQSDPAIALLLRLQINRGTHLPLGDRAEASKSKTPVNFRDMRGDVPGRPTVTKGTIHLAL